MAQESGSSMPQPESNVAQSFAADLDSMFGLTSSTPSAGVDQLSQTVEQKKEKVTSGQSELEQLEARLKETEKKLARVSRQSSPSRQANLGASRERPADEEQTQKQPHPFAQRPVYPPDRPPTSETRPEATRQDTATLMASIPGAMPTTPGVRDDYVMVENGGNR